MARYFPPAEDLNRDVTRSTMRLGAAKTRKKSGPATKKHAIIESYEE